MKLIKITVILAVMTLFTGSLIAQQAIFERAGEIPVPAIENAGFGNVIAGVDLDGDGAQEVFAVNNMYDLGGNELTPRIYKFEWNGTSWDSVWSAEAPLTAQNTWPALTWGDWDKDGKYEVIWGPVNNFAAGDNPYRVLVYESKGDGSDIMGVDDGSGNYMPNAKWTILPDTSVSEQCRPFRWTLTDIDNDGSDELVFGSRRGDRRFGVISVSDIPDNGDGSEVWDLEVSGLSDTTFSFGGGTIYDMVVVDSTIYLFHSGGDVTAVTYDNGTWATNVVVGAVPGGSWKSAQVVDIDGDGTKEIMVAGWTTGNNRIYVLQVDGANITTNVVFEAADMIGASGRFYGGGAGDTDGDGNLDYISGTRNAIVNGMMIQLSYKGGDITDPASYFASVIDQEAFSSGRWGLIGVGNIDDDANDEVVYASDWKGNDDGTPPYRVPLTVLNHVITVEAIANMKMDADGDFAPDMLGDSVTISGVVTSTNFRPSGLQYFIQDATGGVQLFNSSAGIELNVGDFVIASGTVTQYRGLTELEVADPTNDIQILGSGISVPAVPLTIDEFLANAEMYEGKLIKLMKVTKAPTSDDWPTAGNWANITLWHGFGTEFTMHIDSDTDLDDNVEPTWPVNIVGVGSQYTNNSPANDGYQIMPSFYADIEQGVPVPPLPNFAMLEPADGSIIEIYDSTDTFTFVWEKPVDLNGDALIYQFIFMLPDTTVEDIFPTDTMTVFDGSTLLGFMGTSDSVVAKWTIVTKGAEDDLVASSDTAMVTLVNKTAVGIEDEVIPTKFFVNQNYPNPFNPSTVIKFGLPSDASVDLRIYDILGQEVRVLLNNKSFKAGVHSVQFDASGLASGRYIYRLKAGNKIVTKKMMLLK